MDTILLTNIGNRSITLNKETYFDSNKDKSITFLDWTKNLLENYDIHSQNLDINIFNPLVEGENRPAKIMLFYSDQSKIETRTNQDTIHEAHIIQKILVDKYGYNPNDILLEAIEVKVVENGKLMDAYRRKFYQVKKLKFDKIMICDAGGTPQQKMALKIVAEYLLEPNEYEIKYIEGNTLVTDVSVNEYRSIIDTEQALKLIKVGEFVAAYSLLSDTNIGITSKDKRLQLVKYVMYRFNNKYQKCNDAISRFDISIFGSLISDQQNGIVASSNLELDEYFGDAYMMLVDKFYKVIFYWNNQSYSNAILALSQFYESFFVEAIMNSKEMKELYGTPYAKYKTDLQINYLNEYISTNYPRLLENYRPNIDSISTQILVCKKMKLLSIVNIANIMSPYIGHSGDSLAGKEINVTRNKIAHDGLFLTKDDMHKMKHIGEVIEAISKELQLTLNNLFMDLCLEIERNYRI